MKPLRISVRDLIAVLRDLPPDAEIEIDENTLRAMDRVKLRDDSGRFEAKPKALKR